MSNFSKEKNHAIIIDQRRGLMLHRSLESQIDSFMHDIAEHFITVLNVKPIGGQDNLVVLVNDEKSQDPEGMIGSPWGPSKPQLNPWATVLFGAERNESEGKHCIFGDAFILRKKGDKLELFTKDEAMYLITVLNRKGGVS